MTGEKIGDSCDKAGNRPGEHRRARRPAGRTREI
jgi:hypothetical protein